MNQPEKPNPPPTGQAAAAPVRHRAMANPLLVCLLLAAVTLSVYWPLKSFEFINYDDHDYVSENQHVLAGLTWTGVAWAFQTVHASNWHPLTWLSHMLDTDLFAKGAGGAHFMNVLLHAANTVLLFLLLQRLTGAQWRSALVAALFALHPLHVESVAWISERKDVLSTFFGMLALLMYAQYVERAKVQNPKSKVIYGWALLFFALGLLSKPMLVTWPLVMLLLDYWPMQRVKEREFHFAVWRPLLFEKIPFFILSTMSCAITFIVQHQGGAMATLTGVPLSIRIENSLVSYARYLGKMLWPANLAIPYPYPAEWPWWQVLSAAGLVGGLCIAAVVARRKYPYLFTGWFWFWGMLVPVIGLVQVGAQSMADRYTYVPLVGLFVMLVWGAGDLAERWCRLKPILVFGAILILAGCLWRTADQIRYWHDSGALARHSIAVTANNTAAYSNLGGYLLEQGQYNGAIDSFRDVLRTMWGADNMPDDPVAVMVGIGSGDESREREKQLLLQTEPGKRKACADMLNNLGTALTYQGKTNEGMALYRLTILIQPDHPLALYNLAFDLAGQGQYAQAIPLYEQALRAKPDNLRTINALGIAQVEVGRIDEAISGYVEALRISPDDPETRRNLGLALVAQGRPADAIPHFEAVLRTDPRELEVHNNLGSALVSVGKLDDAIRHFRLLLQKKPDHARAHDNLGVALAMQGRLDEAIGEFTESLRYNPNNVKTHFNLGNVLAMQHRYEEAMQQYRETLRLVPDHPQAHCHLGAVLAETGRRNEATVQLREALRLKPDYEEARQQLEKLSRQPPDKLPDGK
jgi:tetratricopeptide (TPR) repeat protein